MVARESAKAKQIHCLNVGDCNGHGGGEVCDGSGIVLIL